MHSPVFFKCKEADCILGLICGTANQAKECMGEDFQVLDATRSEGAGEKHLPVVEVKDSIVTVSVGSVAHPMTKEHSIDWIYLETKKGGQLVKLSPDGEPKAQFALTSGDCVITAYAYCNLHGFWKAEL